MAYNEELVKRLADGDNKAVEEIQNLPITVRMGLGIAADEYRRNNNISTIDNSFSVYEQKKSGSLENDELGNALAKRLEETKIKEELLEKQRQEHAEEVIKQKVIRARALGSYQ